MMLCWYNDTPGLPGVCWADVSGSADGSITIIVAQPLRHGAAGIINCFAEIASALYRDRLSPCPPERIRWVHHIPVNGMFDGDFDEVRMVWQEARPGQGVGYVRPQRRRLAEAEVRALLERVGVAKPPPVGQSLD